MDIQIAKELIEMAQHDLQVRDKLLKEAKLTPGYNPDTRLAPCCAFFYFLSCFKVKLLILIIPKKDAGNIALLYRTTATLLADTCTQEQKRRACRCTLRRRACTWYFPLLCTLPFSFRHSNLWLERDLQDIAVPMRKSWVGRNVQITI